jgi:hypothetical protein
VEDLADEADDGRPGGLEEQSEGGRRPGEAPRQMEGEELVF